jgi:cold shock CspA family protein
MTIDFGKVEKYIGDRGFGFVSHTFIKTGPKEVFFHIKVVKRTHPKLAQVLHNEISRDKIYFWYKYKLSSKGQGVLEILDLEQMRQKYADQITPFINAIKTSWINLEKPLPESLRKATSDLLTSDEANELTATRENLETKQRRHQEKLQRVEAARLKEIADKRAAQEKIETSRRQAMADQRATQERLEEDEFRQLVAEMSEQEFTHSKQVSAYIVRHKLGHKYKHISGILEMELDGDVWNFNGGFPPKIYAQLCDALGLRNQRSRAVPGAFTPYKDIIKD